VIFDLGRWDRVLATTRRIVANHPADRRERPGGGRRAAPAFAVVYRANVLARPLDEAVLLMEDFIPRVRGRALEALDRPGAADASDRAAEAFRALGATPWLGEIEAIGDARAAVT
jgi:hypothetical protein